VTLHTKKTKSKTFQLKKESKPQEFFQL